MLGAILFDHVGVYSELDRFTQAISPLTLQCIMTFISLLLGLIIYLPSCRVSQLHLLVTYVKFY